MPATCWSCRAQGLKNAVVWIDNPPPGHATPQPGGKVEIDQKGCAFIPRVVVVQAGGTVDFLNSDRLLARDNGPRIVFARLMPR